MKATEARPVSIPEPSTEPPSEGVVGQLSRVDRFLPLWIASAMAGGPRARHARPRPERRLDKLQIGTVSLPIAVGLLLMMYPVLAKVRYEDIGRTSDDGGRQLALLRDVALACRGSSAPLLMFALAWIFLADQPAYRTGVIIVGLARCIAMVLVWNDIALGDRERAAVLVVFNALFQVVGLRAARLLLPDRPSGLARLRHAGLRGRNLGGRPHGARSSSASRSPPGSSPAGSASAVAAATGTSSTFIPRIAPITLYGLLFTIVLLFAIQGDEITSRPFESHASQSRCSSTSRSCGSSDSRSGTCHAASRTRRPLHSPSPSRRTTSSSRSPSRSASSVPPPGKRSPASSDPLIEVPVLVALVYVALWLRKRLAWPTPRAAVKAQAALGAPD